MHAAAPRKTVAIVGAGAAGYFAAIKIAENDPAAQVSVYEATRHPLAKVAVSGGGRCNVTHHCFDPRELVRYYPRGSKELRGAFHAWQPQDTVDWFQSRGVSLKTEADGRMFPVTDSSQTIIDCLETSARNAGVIVHLRTGVSDISLLEGNASERFSLTLSSSANVTASHVVIATGGGQTNSGHRLAAALGHRISELAPSLFTFHISHPLIDGLPGLSLPCVRVSYPQANLTQTGPVVFTHWGLSGPGILKLSAWGARAFKSANYCCQLTVNWTGAQSPDQVRNALASARSDFSRRALASINPFDFPRRFWERMLTLVSISPDIQWNQLPKKTLHALTEAITATALQTTGKSMNKEEFVTCGGIDLKEVDLKTLESKRVKSLHFAGEVLDIDGVTGGFNFQAAWTTAHLAATAIASDHAT